MSVPRKKKNLNASHNDSEEKASSPCDKDRLCQSRDFSVACLAESVFLTPSHVTFVQLIIQSLLQYVIACQFVDSQLSIAQACAHIIQCERHVCELGLN